MRHPIQDVNFVPTYECLRCLQLEHGHHHGDGCKMGALHENELIIAKYKVKTQKIHVKSLIT